MADPNKVITRLSETIAALTKENAILRVALEEEQSKHTSEEPNSEE